MEILLPEHLYFNDFFFQMLRKTEQMGHTRDLSLYPGVTRRVGRRNHWFERMKKKRCLKLPASWKTKAASARPLSLRLMPGVIRVAGAHLVLKEAFKNGPRSELHRVFTSIDTRS